jgi:endogenous inhibitor of DNA gyrase (YacG/DUF329 family)
MNTTSPSTEITYECPHCGKRSKLASRAKSDTFTVKCYYCKKETDVQCITLNGQITIKPILSETFYQIPLSFITEETPLLKSPDSYKETISYKPLDLGLDEELQEILNAPTEIRVEALKKRGFLSDLKEDIVTMMNIKVIETDSHVPLFSIVKQRIED